jgi:hypothetical protein
VSDIKPLNWTPKTFALLLHWSLDFQVLYAGSSWRVSCNAPRQGHCIVVSPVAGPAQWMSIASPTAYSRWTLQKPTLFSGHYLLNRSTLDIGVLGYIGIVYHKEHSPEVMTLTRGTPCILKTTKWMFLSDGDEWWTSKNDFLITIHNNRFPAAQIYNPRDLFVLLLLWYLFCENSCVEYEI